MRTRYRVVAPDFTGMTNTFSRPPRNSLAKRSAVARLEKLPNCTAHPRDVGTLAEDATCVAAGCASGGFDAGFGSGGLSTGALGGELRTSDGGLVEEGLARSCATGEVSELRSGFDSSPIEGVDAAATDSAGRASDCARTGTAISGGGTRSSGTACATLAPGGFRSIVYVLRPVSFVVRATPCSGCSPRSGPESISGMRMIAAAMRTAAPTSRSFTCRSTGAEYKRRTRVESPQNPSM